MRYQKEIDKLCKIYKYKQAEYFDGIQIVTTNDWWIIKQEKEDRISLYHRNKRQGTGYHFQKHFFSGKMIDVFEYIKGHEEIPFKSYKKMFRIKELLTMIS